MNVLFNIKRSILRFALFFILMQGILFAQADTQVQGTILTVSEARIDANNDFIPDRMGQKVTVGGRANVSSGVLRTERLQVFLQDEKSGIEIYNTELGSAISEGDSVIATGYVEQFEGLTRLTRTTYRKIPVLRPMPSPVSLDIKQANNEQYEGMILQVQGIVTMKWKDAYGSYLCLRKKATDTDSLVVFIIFRHQAGMDLSKYEIGDQMIVTGILGQYVGSGALNTGYELLPRYPMDITVAETPARMYIIAAYVSLGVLTSVLLWVWLLRRQVTKKTKALRDSENRFHSIFEGTNDAVFVLRDDLIIENANHAACHLCGLTQEDLVTKPLTDLFQSDQIPIFKSRSKTERSKTAFEFEMTLGDDTEKNFHLLAKMNVFELKGAQRVVLVLRDITERKHAEKEREDLINKLTDAFAEVRALSGLLPICSSCKKIRDDKGYWKQLEEYFYSHSDVRFSHGMCPDCFTKFYPTFVKKDPET
jgi:PAS domain S-box-containing protein